MAWLASVDEQQIRLKRGMVLAIRLFLRTVVSGSADNEVFEWVVSIICPRLSKLSHHVSPEERARILSPPKSATPTLTPYVPPPQEEEDRFEKPRGDQHGNVGSTTDDSAADKGETTAHPSTISSPLPERFTVSAKSYRVVTHLFYIEGQRMSGSATFTDLGKLMSEAGFEQYPTVGSAYTFLKPADGFRERKSIVFHTHLNTSSYEGFELRRMGHRLANNFGWSAATFSLG